VATGGVALVGLVLFFIRKAKAMGSSPI